MSETVKLSEQKKRRFMRATHTLYMMKTGYSFSVKVKINVPTNLIRRKDKTERFQGNHQKRGQQCETMDRVEDVGKNDVYKWSK